MIGFDELRALVKEADPTCKFADRRGTRYEIDSVRISAKKPPRAPVISRTNEPTDYFTYTGKLLGIRFNLAHVEMRTYVPYVAVELWGDKAALAKLALLIPEVIVL